MMEEIQDKYWVWLVIGFLQLVSKLEAGGRPPQDWMFQDFRYSRSMPTHSAAKAVLVWEPFSTYDKMKRPKQGETGYEFSQFVMLPVMHDANGKLPYVRKGWKIR